MFKTLPLSNSVENVSITLNGDEQVAVSSAGVAMMINGIQNTGSE